MRRLFVPLALALGGLLIALALCEVALRAMGYSAPIWHRPDPVLGWTLRPGIAAWFTQEGRAWIEVNPAGQRDSSHALDKAPNTYRIAVLGDSYSEAMQVAREEAYWALLPERLQACGFAPGRRIEVLNFGVSGYGTAQQYLVLESTAVHYRPDLVLLQFTNGNDVKDNSRALDENGARPFFVLDRDGALRIDASFARERSFLRSSSPLLEVFRELSDRLRVVQLARAARHIAFVRKAQADGVEQGLEPVVLAPPRNAAWEDAWRVTEGLIVRTRDYARHHGADFLVFTVPYAVQVHPQRAVREALQAKLGVPDLFYPDRRIAELSKRSRIAAVALAPQMQRMAEASGAYFHGFPQVGMGRGHWNVAGHRAAAELIARRLCASPSSANAFDAPAQVPR